MPLSAKQLTQDELAVAGQLSFHFFVHFLIGDASAAHGVLMLRQNVADFVVKAVFDGNFLHHGVADALDDGVGRFNLHHLRFDEFLDHFRRHVGDVIAIDEHPADRFPSLQMQENQCTGSVERVQGGENLVAMERGENSMPGGDR